MLLRSFQKHQTVTEQREQRAQQLAQRQSHKHSPIPDTQPRHHIDYFLLNLVAALTLIGLIAILSASAHVAQSQIGDASYYFKKQLLAVVVGAFGMFLAMRIDIYHLPRLVKPLMVLAILLIAATYFPVISLTINGSSRWLNLPGLRLQPSELAKPILVLYLATALGNPKLLRQNWKERMMLLVPIGAIMALVLRQPDLGTTMVIGATVLIMYFASGTHYLKVGGIILAGFAAFMAKSMSTPYQWARITSWLDPWSDPRGQGFHLIQSMIAIGSGGPVGKGFGQSVQKLFYLPEQHTDFIFAVIAEEFGFLGVCLLLMLFTLLTQRGVMIACKSPTPYLKLLSIGLISMISMQAIVNLAVVSGTIPTTGLTLPFISYGSSSLVVNLAAMGLLLNISRYIPPRLRQKSQRTNA